MPVDDTDLRIRSGNWKSKSASAAYEGTYLKATQRDAVLSRRVVGATSLSLVVGTGPKFGRVKVFLDGVLLTSVSLKGAKGFAKVVPLATFSTPESGRLTIRTKNKKQVRIDGLAVETGP